MRRLIRHLSSRFGHRIAQYSYPELRPDRPRVTERELMREEPIERAAGATQGMRPDE